MKEDGYGLRRALRFELDGQRAKHEGWFEQGRCAFLTTVVCLLLPVCHWVEVNPATLIC